MDTFFSVSPLAIAAIPVALGLVQVVKQLKLPSKYAPIVSIVIGVGLMFIIPEMVWQSAVIQGIIVGLAASGLWSGTKTLVTTNKVDN